MRTRRVLFQKVTAFDIHSTWRGGTPREHFFELLAFSEFRLGFAPLLLLVELHALLVYGTHLDPLWRQLPLMSHDFHGLYGLELVHHLDFVDCSHSKASGPASCRVSVVYRI